VESVVAKDEDACLALPAEIELDGHVCLRDVLEGVERRLKRRGAEVVRDLEVALRQRGKPLKDHEQGLRTAEVQPIRDEDQPGRAHRRSARLNRAINRDDRYFVCDTT